MFDLILKIASVAFIFASPALIYFLVLYPVDTRKSPPKRGASLQAQTERK